MGSILTLIIGVVVGGVLGGLGGGGAVLAVPAFVLLLAMSPGDAGTLSLVVVGTASLIALATHIGHGTVRWRTGLAFGMIGAITAAGGSWFARDLDSAWLLIAFSAIMILAVWRLAVGPSGRSQSAGLPERGGVHTVASALGIGAITGTFGAGGGFLVVPVLATVHGVAMRSAVATSSFVIVINTTLAFASRLLLGFTVNGVQTATAIAGAAAGVVLGRRLASRTADVNLRWAMVGLLVVIAAITAATGVAELAGR